MNFRSTLILLVLLAGVGGGYLLVRSVSPGSEDGSGAAVEGDAGLTSPLVEGRRFDTVRIEQGEREVVLERDGDRWWQVEPVRFVVANEAVEALINAALALRPRGSVELGDGGARAAEVGLDPAAATLAFTGDAGEQTLHLGRGPTQVTYVRRGQAARAYTVDAGLWDLVVDARPAAWRPGVLPAPPAAAVRSVRLSHRGEGGGGGDGTTTLQREAGGWVMGEDGEARADPDTAEALAALPSALELRSYESDDPGVLHRYGLDAPTAAATWTAATGEAGTLRVGRAADLNGERVYATWSDTAAPSPVVFTVDAAAVEPLMRDAAAFRETRLFTADPGLIRGLRVANDGRETLALQRRPTGAWAYAEPRPEYEPDDELVRQLITSITAARTAGDVVQVPVDAPVTATITLGLAGGREETVRLYEAAGRGEWPILLASREGEPAASFTGDDRFAALTGVDPRASMRQRKLNAAPGAEGGEPRGATLIALDGRRFDFVEDGRGGWTLADGLAAEAEPTERLRRWLADPVAAQWLTDGGEGESLGQVDLHVDAQDVTYWIDPTTGAASRSDLRGTFRVPPEVVELMSAELRERTVIPLTLHEMERVELVRGPDGVSVIRRGDDGRYDPGTSGLDEAQAAQVMDVLAGLRAERFAADGAAEAGASGTSGAEPSPPYYDVVARDGRRYRLQPVAGSGWRIAGPDGPSELLTLPEEDAAVLRETLFPR